MEFEIKISELRLAIDRMLERFEVEHGKVAIIPGGGGYWCVPDDQRYAPTPPVDWETGSLFDDWGFLLPTVDDKDNAVPYALVHASEILYRIALLTVPK